MRKTILLLASMASAVLLASGVAWAITTIDCKASKSCQGTGGDDVITGTASRDVIIPYDGTDIVYADPPNKPLTNPPTFPKEGGNDDVRHSFDDDTIYGGGGNDTLRGGRGKDTIYGGPGKDLIDCAYLETRSGDTEDTAYYTPSEGDVVVDCKDKKLWDPTNPYDPNFGK